MPETINVGRFASGGVCNGLFGNPVKEKTVSEQYRGYFRQVVVDHPAKVRWLESKLREGAVLYCPGCGIGSPTCHARIIEEELGWNSH